MPESHVSRWWPGEPDHPIIDELKSRPGVWALIWERSDGEPLGVDDGFWACDRHKRVEVYVRRFSGLGGPDQSVSARWIPDEEWRCGRCNV
jgi:hypothetical protein